MRIPGILFEWSVLGFVLGSVVFAVPAYAAGQLADVQVYDRTQGVILATYVHNGRYFVPGEPGHEYQIHVTNTSGQRLLAVTSVDGVNVISGETASPGQSGYVLGPYNDVLDIAGWRKSMDRIAAFYFTKLRNSYAARTGRPNDVGVIGVALFRERYYAPPPPPPPSPCCWPYRSERDDSYDESRAPAAKSESGAQADAAPPASAQERQENSAGSVSRWFKKESKLGTGHGRNETSVVTYTEFERASSTPDEVVTIYYDSYKNLVAQGVIPTYYGHRDPNPFPQGFVPDP